MQKKINQNIRLQVGRIENAMPADQRFRPNRHAIARAAAVEHKARRRRATAATRRPQRCRNTAVYKQRRRSLNTQTFGAAASAVAPRDRRANRPSFVS